MSRQWSTKACVCTCAGEEEKAENDGQGWGTLSRKCNRLGFASGVSVCNSTSLSQFKSGLCKGSFDCGCSFSHRGPPPPYKCCFIQKTWFPFPSEAANISDSKSTGNLEGWEEKLVRPVSYSLVLELFLEASAMSKGKEV